MSRVSPELLSEWELWKLVIKGIATWPELNSNAWTFDDVMKANDILDVKDAIESAFTPKIPKGKT